MVSFFYPKFCEESIVGPCQCFPLAVKQVEPYLGPCKTSQMEFISHIYYTLP